MKTPLFVDVAPFTVTTQEFLNFSKFNLSAGSIDKPGLHQVQLHGNDRCILPVDLNLHRSGQIHSVLQDADRAGSTAQKEYRKEQSSLIATF